MIRFLDHPAFHRTAAHMAAAGGLAALAVHVASLLEPRLGGLAAPLPLAAVAGAAVYGAAPAETRAGARDLAVVVIGAAIAAGALAAVRRGEMGAAWGLAVFGAALGVLLARGQSGRAFWVAAGAGAGAVLAGRFVLTAVAGASFGPAWLVAAVSGAAFGAVALLGVLPRHVIVRAGGAGAGDEARGLLARARAAEAEPRIRGLLEQLAALDRDAESAPAPAVLAARLAELGQRAEATADPIARREYEKAAAAVAAQLREVEGIAHGRERVLARMHSELAEVERARLSAASSEADVVSRALVEAEDEPGSEPGPEGSAPPS